MLDLEGHVARAESHSGHDGADTFQQSRPTIMIVLRIAPIIDLSEIYQLNGVINFLIRNAVAQLNIVVLAPTVHHLARAVEQR